MASEDEILEKNNEKDDADEEVARLMAELNIDEELSLQGIEEKNDNENEETALEDEDVIPTEEMLDMDEIDAILSDVSDIHPERNKSAKELEERIARYEEDPEAAEEALLGDEEENVSESEEIPSDTTEEAPAAEYSEEDALDFLSSLENVEDMLADVENKANEERERLEAERKEEENIDNDLDEINDILKKSDNNEAVNDDLLSMIEGLDSEGESESEGMFDNPDETVEEEEEKKKGKKEKKKKKKKKKGSDEGDSDENASGEDLEFDDKDVKEKKGLFSKLFGFMFEEDEEEKSEEDGENAENSEDGAAKDGKKNKKDKKGKKGKGKGKGDKPADENAAIEAELEEEDKKSKKKKNKKDKPAKAKKPKKEKAKKDEEPDNSKPGIKKAGIVVSLFFCMTILALVLLFAMGWPKHLAKKEARKAYYEGDYETASNKLYGMKLGDSDTLIYRKASLLYRLELFTDKAGSYELLGDEKKAADALFATYQECDKVYSDAKELDITEEVDAFKKEIADRIIEKYGLSVQDIDEICALKPVYYTIAIENITAGRNFRFGSDIYVKDDSEDTSSGTNEKNEESKDITLEDMLPEEELINTDSKGSEEK
ncbi:MAG: hypothetical protein K6G75_03625 [Lachnospiraceae bacterium]|nr:hypothetical protein [Lachnospiraceae bacterium]